MTKDGSRLESPFKGSILHGKVALVTGGGSGIGFEIARQLGLHGAKVIIFGRRKNVLEKARQALRSEGVQTDFMSGDVRQEESAEKAVQLALETYGRLDVLVNCAAGNFLAVAEELRLKGFRTVMDIDTCGTFNMSKAAFSALRESGDGVIINISATLHYGATWYQCHASAAKAAIDSLTRSLALEWGCYGIRVVGVAPGPVADTAGMSKLAPTDDPEILDELLGESIPLGRVGRKVDMALAVLFLCSPAARIVTGETLVVDGGAWLYRPQLLPRDMVREMASMVEKKSRAVGIAASNIPPSSFSSSLTPTNSKL